MCYMDSGVSSNMVTPADVVLLVLGHSAGIVVADRVKKDTRSIEEEEPADGVAGELCSTVVVAVNGAAVDPAARGGDDAA